MNCFDRASEKKDSFDKKNHPLNFLPCFIFCELDKFWFECCHNSQRCRHANDDDDDGDGSVSRFAVTNIKSRIGPTFHLKRQVYLSKFRVNIPA